MKIDLHCHTKKTKQGDDETRNVTVSKFVETLSRNEVQFVAITNHNEFDKKQYESFKQESLKENIDVWPGIELDVNVNGEKGHLILVGNPKKYIEFSIMTDSLINKEEPDKFIIDIEKLISVIEEFDVILIAHHTLKDHGFSDKAIEQIKKMVNGKKPLMFEPSALKTVGIMYANGINGFIGSDVKDWDNYPSHKIPTLKMDIKGYDTFKLLISKDPHTIDTFINQKEKSDIKIQPFADEGDFEEISFKIYNDINIIFGGKGTGKSKIINSLCNFYKEKFGNSNVEYYPAQRKESDYEKLVKRNIKRDYFNKFNIDECKQEFKILHNWQDTIVTPLSSFLNGFQMEKASANFKKFGFRIAEFSQMISYSNYNSYFTVFNNIDFAISNLLKENVEQYLTELEYENLIRLLNKIKKESLLKLKKEWVELKTLELQRFTINTMKEIATSKTGNATIPSSVGFSDFCSNLFEIHSAAKKIYQGLNIKKNQTNDYIGTITDKGDIYVSVDLYLNPFEQTNVEYQKDRPNVTILKQIYNEIKKIYLESLNSDINSYVTTFNELSSNNCVSLKDCFGMKAYTSIKKNEVYEAYNPSSGEKSMLLLHNVLVDNNKKVYILDEPELSVGHKYINDVIVPRLKELSAMNKIIIISTHDANIAVRTLPLMTVYREYKKTYVGNLFIDELEEYKTKEKKEWTKTSMSYLEGGDFAFKERGDSYGI